MQDDLALLLLLLLQLWRCRSARRAKGDEGVVRWGAYFCVSLCFGAALFLSLPGATAAAAVAVVVAAAEAVVAAAVAVIAAAAAAAAAGAPQLTCFIC